MGLVALMWNLPGLGIEPLSPTSAGGVLATWEVQQVPFFFF